MKAALGYAALALGAGACGRRHHRAARAGCARTTRCSCASGAAASSSCSLAALAAAGVDGVGAASATTSRSATSPRTTPRGTPLLFTITGLWAALEGSILLWALILGGYLTFVAHQVPPAAPTTRWSRWRSLIGLVVALFFFALMLGPANPFTTLSTRPARRARARTRCCRTTR